MNIIDTPGQLTSQLKSVTVHWKYWWWCGFSAGLAVFEPQSETNWRTQTDQESARIIFVNKMDRMGARFFSGLLRQVKDVLVCKTARYAFANWYEDDLWVSLMCLRKSHTVGMTLVFQRTSLWVTLPAELVTRLKWYHELLVETALEQDAWLIDCDMWGETPSIADVKRCIRDGNSKTGFLPKKHTCGSAFKNKGVQNILDAQLLTTYLRGVKSNPQGFGDWWIPVEPNGKRRRSIASEPFFAH